MDEMTKLPILIVEDEPDVQEVLVELLQLKNFSAHVSYNANEALAYLAKHTCNCAILDLSLPDMDGLSLFRTMRGTPSTAHIECVMITGFDSSVIRKNAKDAGCSAFLSKPIRERELLGHIEHIMTNLAK